MSLQTKKFARNDVNQDPGILDTYLDEHADDPELVAEALAIDFMEDVSKIMREKGISRSELADLMGVSRAYVTKLFTAPPNMTLLSITRLCKALRLKPFVVTNPAD